MRHSSACASSCAVLALLGGLASRGNGAALRREARSALGGSASTGAGAQARRRRPPRARRRPRRRRLPPPRRPRRRTPPPTARTRRRPRSGPSAIAPSTSRTPSPAARASRTPSTPRPARPASSASASSTEWFTAGFLCTDKFPCPNPAGGAALTSDTLNHIGRHALARRVALQARRRDLRRRTARSAPTPTATRRTGPSLLQVLGDTDLGIKYMAPVGDVVHLGLFTELWLINGTGSVGLDGGGTSAKFGGHRHGRPPRASSRARPLRFSLNAVYSLDNTGDVLRTPRTRAATPVTRIERYGLGVNRVDHFDFLLGGEAFVADERVRPFIEEQHPFAEQPPELRLPRPTTRATTTASRTTRSSRRRSPSAAASSPGSAGFSLLAAFDIGTRRYARLHRGAAAGPAVDALHRRRLGGRHQDRPPVVKTKSSRRSSRRASRTAT